MPKKKTTTTAKPEEKKPEEEEFRSPVEILESLELLIKSQIQQLGAMTDANTQTQGALIQSLKAIQGHIENQSRVLADFALQVQKLTREQIVFENLSETIFQMQSKYEENMSVIQEYRKETRALTKQTIHHLDQLRNHLIDLQHIWRED